jgi:hypothetical protein
MALNSRHGKMNMISKTTVMIIAYGFVNAPTLNAYIIAISIKVTKSDKVANTRNSERKYI